MESITLTLLCALIGLTILFVLAVFAVVYFYFKSKYETELSNSPNQLKSKYEAELSNSTNSTNQLKLKYEIDLLSSKNQIETLTNKLNEAINQIEILNAIISIRKNTTIKTTVRGKYDRSLQRNNKNVGKSHILHIKSQAPN